ncbi:MAG: NnrU family protein [Myxococcota bacterium]
MTQLVGWHGVLIGWFAFAGIHLLLSSNLLRGRLIARLGERRFRGLYSLGALSTFVWLAIVYADAKHSGPVLWSLSGTPFLREGSIALSFVALSLAIASFFQTRPTDIGASPDRLSRGLTRITRHPAFMFFGIFALSHLLVNGHLSDVIFFGGFPVFAIMGSLHMDSRKRRDPALAAYYANTSLLPLVAIAAGRNHMAVREFPLPGLLIGVIASGLLFAFHSHLFGG